MAPQLFPAKAMYFFLCAGASSLFPFFPVIYRDKGFSGAQIGLLSALNPLIGFFGAPMLGALADYTGAHRTIFILFMVLGMASNVLLLYTSTFAGVLVVLILSNVFLSPLMPLVDNAAFQLLGPESHQSWGKVRLWGAIGWGGMAPLAGLVVTQLHAPGLHFWIYVVVSLATLPLAARLPMSAKPHAADTCTKGESGNVSSKAGKVGGKSKPHNVLRLDGSSEELSVDEQDEEDVFINSNSGMVMETVSLSGGTIKNISTHGGVSASESSKVELGDDEEGERSDGDQEGERRGKSEMPSVWLVFALFKNPEVVTFFVCVWIMGAGAGLIINLLFLHLANLGGTDTLFGLSLTFTCILEVPFFFYSEQIIKGLGGTMGVLGVTFWAYAARLIGYSLLTNPWWVLPIELLHGITYAAMWSACTSYAYLLAPPELGATMQGLLTGVHAGLGAGTGCLVSGLLYDLIGAPRTFQVGATIILLAFVAFVLVTMKWGRTNTDNTRWSVCCWRGRRGDVGYSRVELATAADWDDREDDSGDE